MLGDLKPTNQFSKDRKSHHVLETTERGRTFSEKSRLGCKRGNNFPWRTGSFDNRRGISSRTRTGISITGRDSGNTGLRQLGGGHDSRKDGFSYRQLAANGFRTWKSRERSSHRCESSRATRTCEGTHANPSQPFMMITHNHSKPADCTGGCSAILRTSSAPGKKHDRCLSGIP